MLKKITALKARQNLGQLMNEVSIKEDEYIIERAGKPLVAVIPIGAYTKYKKEVTEAKNRFFKFVDEVRKQNKDVAAEIIEQEIDEAVQAVRKQKARKLKS